MNPILWLLGGAAALFVISRPSAHPYAVTPSVPQGGITVSDPNEVYLTTAQLADAASMGLTATEYLEGILGEVPAQGGGWQYPTAPTTQGVGLVATGDTEAQTGAPVYVDNYGKRCLAAPDGSPVYF